MHLLPFVYSQSQWFLINQYSLNQTDSMKIADSQSSTNLGFSAIPNNHQNTQPTESISDQIPIQKPTPDQLCSTCKLLVHICEDKQNQIQTDKIYLICRKGHSLCGQCINKLKQKYTERFCCPMDGELMLEGQEILQWNSGEEQEYLIKDQKKQIRLLQEQNQNKNKEKDQAIQQLKNVRSQLKDWEKADKKRKERQINMKQSKIEHQLQKQKNGMVTDKDQRTILKLQQKSQMLSVILVALDSFITIFTLAVTSTQIAYLSVSSNECYVGSSLVLIYCVFLILVLLHFNCLFFQQHISNKHLLLRWGLFPLSFLYVYFFLFINTLTILYKIQLSSYISWIPKKTPCQISFSLMSLKSFVFIGIVSTGCQSLGWTPFASIAVTLSCIQIPLWMLSDFRMRANLTLTDQSQVNETCSKINLEPMSIHSDLQYA